MSKGSKGEFKKLVFDKNTKKLELIHFESMKPQSGRVLVEVFYSGINYKDALGVTGRGAIFKTNPIVPGIDLVGRAQSGIYKGKMVLGQGSGFGESFDGGYTEQLLCDEELLIPLPEGLSSEESMALGTAGFTAALAAHRMLENGQNPEKGPILVGGATGGVGSFAIQIFKKLGFEVHALTHRMEFEGYLKDLGADEVLNYKTVFSSDDKLKPLMASRWGGVVDNLGGGFLEKALPQVSLWGNVASIGLARGVGFSSTVMPFILRGVSLLGVSSANCPKPLREKLWQYLATDWKPSRISELINQSLSLEEVLDASHKILDHKARPGRSLVKILP